jgi:hypothetical protein
MSQAAQKLKQLRFFLPCISTFIELGNIWEQLLFEQVDRISLGTPAGVRVDLQSRRQMRMSKMCLCNLQRSSLRMQQRAMRVAESMPTDSLKTSSLACGS